MFNEAYAVFCNAILDQQEVTCIYNGSYRELLPRVIGTAKSGEKIALAQQLGGESSGRCPQWRCFKLAYVRKVRVQRPLG
jgi:hypothetical protein